MQYVFDNIAQGLGVYLSFFPFFAETFVVMLGTLVPLGLLAGYFSFKWLKR